MPPPVRQGPGGRWHMTTGSPHVRSREGGARRDRTLRVAGRSEYGAPPAVALFCFATLDRSAEQRFRCFVKGCWE
jgi:hypothetical protein